ncbi:MAG: endonuclease III [Spirochaetes bacterium]|nr:endonuclease III [Spirochaetota bacterium]
MNRTRAVKIIEKLAVYYGETKADLSFSGLYELTIAVVLSAQTTDKQVNSVTPALFKKYPDFRKLANASISDVENIIRGVGLYKTKTGNIIKLSKMVINEFKGKLPDTMEELIRLPGVGRKSANVILSIGYNKPAIAVDTHVLRISNRIGFIDSPDPVKVETALMSFIPRKYWIKAHLLLIKHGRNICPARNPECNDCPVNKLCDFGKKEMSLI